jgi:tetratricopeptide (TPR) repeat protein
MSLAEADRHIDAGLEHNPRELELLSLSATARFLAGDAAGLERVEHQVLGHNPSYSGLYRIIGDYADWEHRYDELVELMRKALRIDDQDAKARAQLGLNLIRAGRDAEGVAELRRAFDEDPFNIRVHNTLRLYEETIPQEYVTAHHGPFRIRYHKQQRALLERYVPELLDRAWTQMTAAYGVVPETPLGVELYAEPESFAVRTSGLPRVPIQGVCFGRTLAVMTPGQQPLNLGMTLWHELAHVFHIHLSHSRVPRWFTEGLAEDETTRARPEWRREHDLELYEAMRQARLPAIDQMNRAFTHARDMDDMATAYYASGKVVQMLRERYGMARVAQMIRLWGQGLRTEQVLERGLSVPQQKLDRQFRQWLARDLSRYRGQFLPPRAHGLFQKAKREAARARQDPRAQAVWVLELLGAEKLRSAHRVISKARSRYPRSAEVLWASAKVEAAHERWAAAEEVLRRLLGLRHDGYAIQLELAKLRLARGDPASAVAALQAAHEFDVQQAEPIRKLAAMAAERKDEEGVLRWLRKLASLEQTDPGVYRELLRRLVARKLYDEACEVAEAAVYVDMTGLETHLLFAEALQAQGSGARALYELESAALCSGPPALVAEAHERLARAYEARGDRRKATMTRHKLEALRP